MDPYERADITSNTYWDWNLNEIGGVYGSMQKVFDFVETFIAYPPRSFPPSFVPSTIMEETLKKIKAGAELKKIMPQIMQEAEKSEQKPAATPAPAKKKKK